LKDAFVKPTYKRQRFLLSFIHQLDENVTVTDIQKLAFLHTMSGESNYYEFIPYKFGAYSFQLGEDLDILAKNGYITVDNLQRGKRIKAVAEYSDTYSYQIASERGNALIRRSYREYPYYTIKSEITERLFDGEELDFFYRIKQSYVKTEQALFTIGYEGKSIEYFINCLIKNDIRLLCDIRKNPLSRKFGFSKSKLKHVTQTIGIKYVHIPELGIESDKRNSLRTKEDYRNLFAEYENSLKSRKIFLDDIYNLIQQNDRVALMCFELDPEMCHRHVVRDYIINNYNIRSVDI
jgi:uncharacterized protein (DUF488 family)